MVADEVAPGSRDKCDQPGLIEQLALCSDYRQAT